MEVYLLKLHESACHIWNQVHGTLLRSILHVIYSYLDPASWKPALSWKSWSKRSTHWTVPAQQLHHDPALHHGLVHTAPSPKTTASRPDTHCTIPGNNCITVRHKLHHPYKTTVSRTDTYCTISVQQLCKPVAESHINKRTCGQFVAHLYTAVSWPDTHRTIPEQQHAAVFTHQPKHGLSAQTAPYLHNNEITSWHTLHHPNATSQSRPDTDYTMPAQQRHIGQAQYSFCHTWNFNEKYLITICNN